LDSVYVATMIKPEQTFVFIFDDANRTETLRQISKLASNPDIEFSWFDAALVCREIRDAKHPSPRIK
jgi:hypothetical protein